MTIKEVKEASSLKEGDAIMNKQETDIAEVEDVLPMGHEHVAVHTADGEVKVYRADKKIRVYRI